MATKTVRVWDGASKDPKNAWFVKALSEINTTLNSNLPQNAKITGAKLIVNADYDGGTALSQVYIKYGFGYTGNFNVPLLDETRITQSGANYSAAVDLKYFSSLVYPFAFVGNVGSYLTINIYTSNNLVSKFNINYVDLEITYEVHSHSYTSKVTTEPTCTTAGVMTYTCSCGSGSYTEPIPAKGHTWVDATCTAPKTCSVCGATEGSELGHNYEDDVVKPTETSHGYTRHTCSRCGHYYDDSYTYLVSVNASPANGGTVSGGGIYGHGDIAGISAEPNEGYEFVQWSDGLPYSERLEEVTGSATYTAVFEKIKYSVELINDGGTVTGLNVGVNEVEHGQTITLTAVADKGYKFYAFRILGGDDGELPSIAGDHTDNPFTFTVVENLWLIVFFDEILPPEITSVQMLYSNKQISADNKVPAGEYFRIVVGAIAHH